MGSQRGTWARWLAVAVDMAMMPAAGALIGHYVDQHFGTDPILTLTFCLLGVVAGFVELIRTAKEMQQDS
jgi:F0F1-type ATP synthase assembly protein I